MKKRLIKIWGIGLTTILLVSMLLAAAPVSAGTLSFTEKVDAAVPSTTNEFLAEGSSLLDMAVSTDGEVIYVLADIGTDKIFKSVDGGVSWTEVALPTTPSPGLADVQLVAIAPDDPDIVVVAGDTDEVYVSTDGGSSFSSLNDSAGFITDIVSLDIMYDVAISALSGSTRYIAIAGVDDAVSAKGCVFYFNLGATAPVWYNAVTEFGTGLATVPDSFRAVAFSPNFASDEVMLLVSEIVGGAIGTGSLNYHIASFNQDEWDSNVFDGYPVELETNAGGAGLIVNAADISIDPEYLGGDDATRIVFIGASATDNADEVGGYYRLKDTTVEKEKDGTGINSVAWDGTDLVAGAYATNDVYRSADALASSPTVSGSRSNKEIGVEDGADKVVVRWSHNNVVGIKQGAASAFGVSTDNGKTWNSTALIDSALATAMDLAVSPDGSVLYLLAADSGNETSLYRQASTWQKVFCIATDNGSDTDWIVRIAASNPDVVYIADRTEKRIYYSTDGGTVKWTVRTSRYALQDIAVQDEDVAYVVSDGKDEVSKTTNGGFTWNADVDTKLSGGDIHSITLLSDDNLLVGGEEGYVSYSSDGNASWTKISTVLSGAGLTQVTATGLATGDFIFAGTDANDTIERWEIGQTGTTWKDLLAPVDTGYGTFGLVLTNDVLYAITCNVTGYGSELQRTMELSTATPSASKWAEEPSDDETFDRAPSSLRASGGTDLWVLDSVANGLWSLTDTVATGAVVELVAPADGFQNPVNPVSGYSQDIAFSWTKPTTGTLSYTVNIYADAACSILLLATPKIDTDAATPNVLIGPNQNINALEFAAGETYYWKVRVTDPFYSPYSEARSFTVQPLAAQVPTVLSPANGTDEASPRPSFSWAPVAGASNYQFQLALNPYINAPIVDVNIASTAYRLLAELERGTTYYWRVQATAPVSGDWSAVSNFTVAELPEAAPAPIVIEQLPAPVINIPPAPAPIQPADIIIPAPVSVPAPIAPAYIWAVIIIGAVLVIAVIVLIVRTRRTV